ncbi:Carbonic anhydrase [Penicillium cf. viridicatum]|uniref:Carbonic anhydrase n=1 Tax=Penicillium cf. viridicatum TaxID=2972119 RepID=A0A9W9SYL2_9EURO|nr:Carbonic anhydrase [Penicillium cf. viridicatum]
MGAARLTGRTGLIARAVGDSKYSPGSLLTTQSRMTRSMTALSAALPTKPGVSAEGQLIANGT